MTFRRLLLRNLVYHWHANLAIFLGVVVGTAVLTGALLVGDSLRGSLQQRTLEQLGWIDYALVSGRFVREDVAEAVKVVDQVAWSSPAILLRGSIMAISEKTQSDDPVLVPRRAGKVAFVGVDRRFWHLAERDADLPDDAFWDSARDEVVLNSALAEELGVKRGDTVTLQVPKASDVPRESLLGRRDAGEVIDELRLKVVAVVSDASFGGRFNLIPAPMTPRNAFVPLRTLQTKLGLARRVNAILVGCKQLDTPKTKGELARSLKNALTLDDWGLVVNDPKTRAEALIAKLDRNGDGQLQTREWRGHVAEAFAEQVDTNHDGVLTRSEIDAWFQSRHRYFDLESKQMLLEPFVADAARLAAQATQVYAAPTLVYLANGIACDRLELGALAASLDPAPFSGLRAALTFQMPYSIIAALDPSLPSPLGKFLPKGVDKLEDDEIILVDWQESTSLTRPGDRIRLTYFLPEEQGGLRETSMSFRLAGIISLQGAADDPNLTPDFPGITDKLNLRDWNPPFPYDNKRIRKADDDYWKRHRTTPKAYVTLAAGQRLWKSRFGELTSIRLVPLKKKFDINLVSVDFRNALLGLLDPQEGGMVFEAVRQRGLRAAVGGRDFGELFAYFSFFLIAAALLLVGLLFRVSLDRRASECGLLLATGFRLTTVRRCLMAEGGMLAAAGALVGSIAALLYAWMLLELLRSLWPTTLERSFLHLHASAQSLAGGYVGAVIVSLTTIALAVRGLGKVAPCALLRGETLDATDIPWTRTNHWRLVHALLVFFTLAAAGCFAGGYYVHDQEGQASTFFGSGASLLIAGLAAFWLWMGKARHARLSGRGWPALIRLGLRNATRNPVRSMLTAGLMASASFLVVAVDSFRREPTQDFLDKNAGSGGFALVAESTLPIFQDLNDIRGRAELNISDEASLGLEGVDIHALRRSHGDDASCLNLYQPRRPRLLGASRRLVARGGFSFQSTEARSPAEVANPWLLLETVRSDGAIPVFGEANTVAWMLNSGLGQEIKVPDENGVMIRLRIVGLFVDSVFQGELVMAESQFLEHFHKQEGYDYFLIETSQDNSAAVLALLEHALADRGFEATPTIEKLQTFLAVENTYLTTFQALGGLGLLLGTLGLAIVLIRNVWERRSELALLRALGYRQTALGGSILAENIFLMLLGLGIGAASALLAVAPHLLEHTGGVHVTRILALFAGVSLVGLLAGTIAVATTLRTPLIPALRRL